MSILEVILPTHPTEGAAFEKIRPGSLFSAPEMQLSSLAIGPKSKLVNKTDVVNMEACCSLKSLVGSSCGFDAKDRKRQTQIVRIPFLSCTKNISKHWSTLSFSGLQNEIDLVQSGAALVDQAEERIKSMTICPRHRATLGISWTRGGGTRCRVPQAISGHGRSRGTWPKGDRGLGKQDSALILRNTGVFIPAGSGNIFIY